MGCRSPGAPNIFSRHKIERKLKQGQQLLIEMHRISAANQNQSNVSYKMTLNKNKGNIQMSGAECVITTTKPMYLACTFFLSE